MKKAKVRFGKEGVLESTSILLRAITEDYNRHAMDYFIYNDKKSAINILAENALELISDGSKYFSFSPSNDDMRKKYYRGFDCNYNGIFSYADTKGLNTAWIHDINAFAAIMYNEYFDLIES